MEQSRRGLLIPLGFISLILVAFTWLAAARNRCGAWPGELPLDRIWGLLRGGAGASGEGAYRSPATALFRSEAIPTLRLLAVSWLALVVTLFVFFSVQMRESHRQLSFSLNMLPVLAMNILPLLGVLWMAGWSLFAAGEPSAVFRSRLSSFRAVLPVSCGALAAQRIVMLFAGWCAIWLPLVLLSFRHDPELLGIPIEHAVQMRLTLARFTAVGAFLAVGSLPVLLWGRFEGFPNFLLCTVCAWAFTWALAGSLSLGPEEEPGWRWGLLAGLFGVKLLAAAVAAFLALRRGHTTWRFPVLLFAGWLAVVVFMLWGLPVWRLGGAWQAACLALTIPLARLAWCPLAIAANRHRA